ncbi:MAG TPA: hypothetical protein VLM38_09845 [Blastocatellia bacterium]|nr:hypothetical protein [Blastocatellia bacterium]
MDHINKEARSYAVLGQKYAYATISLVMGIVCFVNFAGLEKAILAIVFGWLALKHTPPPDLTQRRRWAKAGITLGILLLLVVPTVIILNLERLRGFIEALQKLSDGR